MVAMEYSDSGQMNPRESVDREFKDGQINGDFLESQTRTFSAFYPDSSSPNTFEGGRSCHYSSVDSQFSYPPMKKIYLLQDFRYFVVIDFEATCDKKKIPFPQEIIEFPSVIVSGITGDIVAHFQTYVRPTFNPLLTDFCKDLTGIQQHQVDGGVTLSEALLIHDEWLKKFGINKTNFAVVTWSNWDCRVMLESECQYKKINKPCYFNQWINLRVPFWEVFGSLRCSLKEAVEIAGLSWMGRAHCGLDDAKNTARLLVLLMNKGVKLSITDSLTKKLEDQSSPRCKADKKEENLVYPHCFCGVICKKRNTTGPGAGRGVFFGCGNWSPTRGSRCKFFKLVFP